MAGPRLDSYTSPGAPRAHVLMLHGGQERSSRAVEDRHASWWRMAAMSRSLVPFCEDNDLALSLLQHRVRGWNSDVDPAPVPDARWAIDQLASEHPGVPVVLVGHSMGGRTACRAADHPAVLGVVGLAPWLPLGEPHDAMRDRHLHVIHGTSDRWTSASASRTFVEHSVPIAIDATWTSLPGAGHFMLRHVTTWRRFVEDSVTDIISASSSHEEASNKGSA